MNWSLFSPRSAWLGKEGGSEILFDVYLLMGKCGFRLGELDLQIVDSSFQALNLSFQLLLALTALSEEFDDVLLLLMVGRWNKLQGATR